MIYVVGLGPGEAAGRTHQADSALAQSDVLTGYTAYIELIRGAFPDKPVVETGMRGEAERCRQAIALSREGRRVAMVCSGDAAVYGMASLLLELSQGADEIVVVPGVTAALSASAVLGAPLSGDFAVVSLSDLLTPWAVIERRLTGAALGDFCLALYNPSSVKRAGHLSKACEILLRHQPAHLPCGWVRNIGREGQCHKLTTLGELAQERVDMFTTVIIGNSLTQVIGGRLVTPRGYPV